MGRKRTLLVLTAAILACALSSVNVAFAQGGFDEFGYNYKARVFVGKADGVDRVLDGKVWGDPAYANDHLVMKWSKAWDDAFPRCTLDSRCLGDKRVERSSSRWLW
jgi:hypothetical protein